MKSANNEPGHIGIADALFTKSQQRVLGLLYSKTDRSFYLNEIVRHANMGRGVIKRELDKLSQAGILTMTPKGNQTHYQANSGNPIFKELKGIVVKTVGVAEIVKAALQPLLQSNQVWSAAIYGSIAKGTEHGESDVDLMIVADDVTYIDVMSLLEPAEQSLARSIHPQIYTSDEFKRRKEKDDHFVTSVLSQPTIDLM